jgi:hypothetical protein
MTEDMTSTRTAKTSPGNDLNTPNSEAKQSSALAGALDEMALLECIDDGLGVLGKNDQQKIYWRLLLQGKMSEASGNVKGILRDPEGFSKAIQDTFGLGAWAIERAISWEIKKRFGLENAESMKLPEIIKSAMKRIVESEEED